MSTTMQRPVHFEKVANAIGTYWKSDAGITVLRNRLSGFERTDFCKTADIGGSSEQGFEQAFSSLAYAYMKDKAPRLIEAEDLRLMKPGAVIIDVAIDQGGCAATSRPTTHANPTFVVDDVVH